DVEPGEFVGRCVNVADDVAPRQCERRAGDRLRQRRHDDPSQQQQAGGAPAGNGLSHAQPPRSISTRADIPGTSLPSSGLRRSLIFTDTRWTTRTKLPVALSAGIRLNAEPLPGAKLSTSPSNGVSG